MVKVLKRVVLLLVLTVLTVSPISAYEFPDESYYVHAVDSKLGEVTIYFPINTVNLSLDVVDIVNVGSSNITGYFERNGTEYTVTFQPFQYGRYRLTNTSQYEYLSFGQILDTNIDFVSVNNKNLLNNYQLIIISLISIGVMSLWIQSLKH